MEKIAIIAGIGKTAITFIERAEEKNIEVHPIALFDEVDEKLKEHKNYRRVRVSQLPELIQYIILNDIKKVIMLGKVEKELIYKDTEAISTIASIMPNLSDKKDSTLILSVISFLTMSGIEVLPQNYLLEDFMTQEKNYTVSKVEENDLKTIEIGKEAALALTKIDVGQTIVCKDSSVVAIEAIEGTDATIERAGKLAGEGTIVVKMARPNQDMRVDIPTVGIDTIKKMIEIKAKGLVIEAEKMIILDEEKVLELANEHSIFVLGIKA